MISIIKKETTYRPYGLASSAFFTPYYFKMNEEEYFIYNLVGTSKKGDYKNSSRRNELAQRIKQLKANKFKYICSYCAKFNCPIEFVKYVKNNNLTFISSRDFFNKTDNFTDFGGNLASISWGFTFRIYDEKLLEELKNIFKSAKQEIY